MVTFISLCIILAISLWHYHLQTTRMNLSFRRDIEEVEDLVDSYVCIIASKK